MFFLDKSVKNFGENMTNQGKYILTGGIFLSLLIHAGKKRNSARNKLNGEKDKYVESDFLENLIKIVCPNFGMPKGKTSTTETSDYKLCKVPNAAFWPFDNSVIIENFDKGFRDNYAEYVQRMHNFVNRFIDTVNMKGWLVNAILTILSKDAKYNNELFYIDSSSKPYTLDELLNLDEYELEPFLLGIWHFIIMNRPDNTLGIDTFDAIHESGVSHTKRKLNQNIGASWIKDIKIKLLQNEINILNPQNENTEGDIDSLINYSNPPATHNSVKAIPAFEDYIKNAEAKYSQLKTLLYNDTPRDFYDFYVCNNIFHRIYKRNRYYRHKKIEQATAKKIQEISNFTIITGTGGMGKSMMMRHLFLNTLDNIDETNKMPIFISLKDYNDDKKRLIDYIFEKFESLGGTSSLIEFTRLLSNGSFLLLLDGLDEIKSDYRSAFEQELDVFADRYSDNMFIISSRPVGSFVSLNRFTLLELSPFSEEQAIELIDKLDFRPDAPEIKEKFRTDLSNFLYKTHREFIQNPLLLSIMLMTYEQFAEIPSKMHVFYKEAYLTLSQKHDANKGAYKRVLKTGLTAENFSKYFAEFCAQSYYAEKFEFTETQFEEIFNNLKVHNKFNEKISAADFMADLTDNMCLMFYEGGRFHFTHRSFQEYFCALYFSTQMDKNLERIGDFFNSRKGRHYSDNTFSMLYDMIPEKIEEYIFKPYLISFFEHCDSKDGYWEYLRQMYPTIRFEIGETPIYAVNEACSYLYRFITEMKHFNANLRYISFPEYDDFNVAKWTDLKAESEEDDLVSYEEVPADYVNRYGEPEIIGWSYEIDVDYALENEDEYPELFDLLNDDEFPLKREYLAAREYTEKLTQEPDRDESNLFDFLN